MRLCGHRFRSARRSTPCFSAAIRDSRRSIDRFATSFGPFDVVMLEIGAFHPSWGDIHWDRRMRCRRTPCWAASSCRYTGVRLAGDHAWDTGGTPAGMRAATPARSCSCPGSASRWNRRTPNPSSPGGATSSTRAAPRAGGGEAITLPASAECAGLGARRNPRARTRCGNRSHRSCVHHGIPVDEAVFQRRRDVACDIRPG